MSQHQECIAMLLAGGQGSRLGVLTRSIAKPAVPYGGKYRMIDFPLSNCVNSGIDTVGVLTQYQPQELNDYLGNGQPWDLDRASGGLHVLSPYQQLTGTQWYRGSANAVYQHIPFIERYSPEHVLVLGGDHIYKMDYARMLAYHKEKGAACTIAMQEVPWEEASRLGLIVANEDGSIREFEEKPANPTTNMASMGIYVFTWEKLRKYLIEDEANPDSRNDFGRDIIPAMHRAGERMFAYAFEGYWKDVGTIDSLWEANLDLLNPKIDFDLNDPDWKIYYRTAAAPPHYVAEGSLVQNAMVAEGCAVEGEVDFSILFPNVAVEPGVIVRDSILMPGARVKAGAVVQYAIVAENAVIEENAVVGARPEETPEKGAWGVAVVGAGLTVGKGAVVAANEMVEMDKEAAA